MADVVKPAVDSSKVPAKPDTKQGKEREPLATGSHTGGPVRINSLLGEATTVSQTYVGVGALLVPCTRGEQKAVSGDVMVSIFVDKPNPNDDYEFIFLLPKEIADFIGAAVGGGDGEPVTAAAYQKFLDDRAKRKAERLAEWLKKPTPAVTVTKTTVAV